MASQSPPERGPTPPPGQPGPGAEPIMGSETPEPPWPSGAIGRDEPQWPTEAPWTAGPGPAPSRGVPTDGPAKSGDFLSANVVSRDVGPHDGPSARSIPAQAAWWGVPGILAGYALAVVGATIGEALSGSATGPVTTLFSEMGLWAGMLGTVIFVSRRYGSASLSRDFGLGIRRTDILWGPVSYTHLAMPARRAARQRLSPAISSYSSSSVCRTRIGCSTPISRTEAVRDASPSSSKCDRG